MNKSAIFLLSFLFLSASMLHAQLLPKSGTASTAAKTIKNGTIHYTVNVQSEEPGAAMLNSSTFEVAFNGHHSKVIAKVMGGVIGGNFILDSGSKAGLALLDIMGQKRAIKMGTADIDKAKASTSSFGTGNVQFLKDTKTIAGHVCKKALVTDPKHPEAQMVVYICEAIQPESAGLMDNMLKTFKGFPLGFEVKNGKDKVIIMASEVSQKIPKKSEFDLSIPSGYEETTIEELENEMGGMIKP